MYAGPEIGGEGNYFHSWNRSPDGTIVDATANQFGDANPIRVIPPNDPRQHYYLADIS